MQHTGKTHELLRKLVGLWPFERGTQRIPTELGRVFPSMNSAGVVGGVGSGNVRFPFQPGDLSHPGYWFLYERGVRRVIGGLLSPGSIYIDVGAHRGWHAGYALSLVSPGGAVITCEPHPHHAQCLRQLASLNEDKDLRVHQSAVALQSGEATLLASKQEGWHTIIPEFNELCNVPRTPLKVSTLRLDDLVEQHADLKLDAGAPRVVIKIDAEGAERDILRGASTTLRLASLRAVVMECTGGPGEFRGRALECIKLLDDAGWKSDVITQGGRRRPWVETDADTQVNILAVRK